jgi:hypothetical protein
MGWKFWQKKTPPPAPQRTPFVALELDPGSGKVKPVCSFGDPKSEAEANAVANGMAHLAFLLNDGRFLALLQQGLVTAGTREGVVGMANAAMDKLNELLVERAMQKAADDEPVVPATEVLGRDER